MRCPMDTVLARVEVAPDVRSALLTRTGTLAPALMLGEAYESGDWDFARDLATHVGVEVSLVAEIYVDALSGRDGHPLWHWHVDLPENKHTAIRPPRWWGSGPDGWPLLAVPLGGPELGKEFDPNNSYLDSPVVHVLEAPTGR